MPPGESPDGVRLLISIRKQPTQTRDPPRLQPNSRVSLTLGLRSRHWRPRRRERHPGSIGTPSSRRSGVGRDIPAAALQSSTAQRAGQGARSGQRLRSSRGATLGPKARRDTEGAAQICAGGSPSQAAHTRPPQRPIRAKRRRGRGAGGPPGPAQSQEHDGLARRGRRDVRQVPESNKWLE